MPLPAPQRLKTLQAVQDYYGKVLQSSKDLKTSACCSVEALPAEVREVAKLIHPEIVERFYGCGSPFPPALQGRTVLDLGCGSGRDVYLLSKLVGQNGRVIGVDMTEEQLAVARKHVSYHADRFGYERSNVEFKQGFIEDLRAAGVADESVDLVVSNCVTNLSPDKPALFSEVWRVLKPGGELYFSDVFVDRRLPAHCAEDPVLLGECLGAAMYTEDFRRVMNGLGCLDFRLVSQTPVAIRDPEIARKLGNAQFRSLTFRVFKLALEDKCEDYGQVAVYRGTLPESPDAFVLDDHHVFEAHRPMLVCGNTADMVSKSAYREHFTLWGDKAKHFGLFPCGPAGTSTGAPVAAPSAGACC